MADPISVIVGGSLTAVLVRRGPGNGRHEYRATSNREFDSIRHHRESRDNGERETQRRGAASGPVEVGQVVNLRPIANRPS